MRFIDTLTSQPLSLWLSLVATLISISSFLLSFKNSRKSRRLETLQKRTQLLFKITEAKLKLEDAKIELTNFRIAWLDLKELPIIHKGNNYGALNIDSFDEQAEVINKTLINVGEKIESLRTACNEFSSKTNPEHVENLLPLVQDAQMRIETASNRIANSTKILGYIVTDLKSGDENTTKQLILPQ